MAQQCQRRAARRVARGPVARSSLTRRSHPANLIEQSAARCFEIATLALDLPAYLQQPDEVRMVRLMHRPKDRFGLAHVHVCGIELARAQLDRGQLEQRVADLRVLWGQLVAPLREGVAGKLERLGQRLWIANL